MVAMATSTSQRRKTTRSLTVKDLDKKATRSTKKRSPKPPKATSTTATKRASKKAPKKVTKKASRKTTAKTTAKTTRSKATKAPAAKSPTRNELAKLLKRNPLGHLLIESKLREAGFRGSVSTDKELLEKYSTDESIFSIHPQVIIQPKSTQDVVIAVSTLAEYAERFPSISLTPRAAGTGLSGGSLTDSIVIDVCTHMHHIDTVRDTGEAVSLTCQPGAMFRDVEAKLKAVNHYIPAYPASKDICSIGGCVGNNAAGPDSLRYGHFAEWIESLEVVFHDGTNHTIQPLTYKQMQKLIKKNHAYGRIAKEIFALIEKHEKAINKMRPETKKNTAGYNLWDVLDTSVAQFKKGSGRFDLTRLIAGSQGTIGIVTEVTLKAEPIATDTSLIVVPVFNLADASSVVQKALEFDPINVEIFDGLSFDLALKNPDFFKDRLSGMEYYRVMLKMYTTYHLSYKRKIPEFTLLITLDSDKLTDGTDAAVHAIRGESNVRPRLVSNPTEAEMYWQIRRASYTLSKFMDTSKRPAAFLEDMTVPPKNLGKFFTEVKKLLQKYNVTAAVHGHGGNGHFHFYPLLDFTNKTTPKLVEKMAEEFFNTAIKYDGNICGEHNDGIIRTPHLNKLYTKKELGILEQVEHIFDPHDIFNPGKKVHPRFDVKDTMRTHN